MKYSKQQFMAIVKPIIEREAIINDFEKTVNKYADALNIDSITVLPEMLINFADSYINFIFKMLDDMYETDDYLISWWFYEVVYWKRYNTDIMINNNVYIIDVSPESIWNVIEEEYL